MMLADDSEMLGGDWLGVLAHRRHQLGDAGAIDLLDSEECLQGLMRAAHLFQHLALNGGPGKPAELGDEFPHRATLTKFAIPGHVRCEIAL
jgi:hypothetical protein